MDIKFLQLSFYLLAFLLAPINIAQADIKCWRNKDNVRECGQAVPPEYSQERIEVINSKGIIVETIPGKEELEEIRRQKKIQEAEERKKAAKRRQDVILLQTYTTERDLELARKQNLQAVQAIIDLTSSNTDVIKKDLASLEKNAADFERNGEQAPSTLIKDMENLKRQIKENEEFIAQKKQAKQDTNAKFDANLKRFRELKGTKPEKKSGQAKNDAAAKP